MLNTFARTPVSRCVDPVGRWLVRCGVHPNLVTVVGAAGAAAGVVWFLPQNQLILGVLVTTVFSLFDVLDGAMARAKQDGNRFGTVLDASCDRIVDGAIFAAITWWAFFVAQDRLMVIAALLCLVSGQVISYIKARADAAGLSADGGLMERAERLILGLTGVGLAGLEVPYAPHIVLWLLAILSLITIGQRLVRAYQSEQGAAAA